MVNLNKSPPSIVMFKVNLLALNTCLTKLLKSLVSWQKKNRKMSWKSGPDIELPDEGFYEPEVVDIIIPDNLADVHVSVRFKITMLMGVGSWEFLLNLLAGLRRWNDICVKYN